MPVSVLLQGARIRTLPASLSPVIIGVCCAWKTLHTTHHLQVNYPLFWIETVLCLGIAFFLQIAANFAILTVKKELMHIVYRMKIRPDYHND